MVFCLQGIRNVHTTTFFVVIIISNRRIWLGRQITELAGVMEELGRETFIQVLLEGARLGHAQVVSELLQSPEFNDLNNEDLCALASQARKDVRVVLEEHVLESQNPRDSLLDWLLLAEKLDSPAMFAKLAGPELEDDGVSMALCADAKLGTIYLRYLLRDHEKNQKGIEFVNQYSRNNRANAERIAGLIGMLNKETNPQPALLEILWDGLIHCQDAPIHVSEVVPIVIEHGIIGIGDAVELLVSLGEKSDSRDFTSVFRRLMTLDDQRASEFWERWYPTIAKDLTSVELSALLCVGSLLVDHQWDAVCKRLIGEDALVDLDIANQCVEAIDARSRANCDFETSFELMLAVLSAHGHNVAFLRTFVTRSASWKLWVIDDLVDQVLAATISLPLVAKRYMTALCLRIRGDCFAALSVLSTLDSIDTGKFGPLLAELKSASEIHTLGNEELNQFPISPIPPGEEVILICDRDGDPTTALSWLRRQKKVILCAMDTWRGPGDDLPEEYWSLRDLFSDADPTTSLLTHRLRAVAESAVSSYMIESSRILGDERDSKVGSALAIALEDALVAPATIAGCVMRAIEQYRGKYVVIACRDANIFLDFADTILSSGKRIYLTTNLNSAGTFERQIGAYVPEPRSVSNPDAAGSFVARTTFFRAKRSLDTTKFAEGLVKPNYPAVALMSAFTDPIYVENTIPVIRGLLTRYDVYVLEPLSVAACRVALEATFGKGLTNTGSDRKLTLVDCQQTLAQQMRALPTAKAAMVGFAAAEMLKWQHDQLKLDSWDLSALVRRRLADSLTKAVVRFDVCSAVYRAVFEAIPFVGLIVSSERLPVRTVAVAVARDMSLRSVDVMAVNSIKLPRYRRPEADFLTSIDTITSTFFEDFYGTKKSKIVLTGSPRMDMVIDRISRSNADQTLRVLGIERTTTVILYACQLQPMDRCVSILEQLLRVAEDNEDVLLLVKLHRRENRSRELIYAETVESSSAQSKVKLIRDEAYLSDITNLLKVSQVVVSLYSNALREAACMGIPFVAADYFSTALPFEYASKGIGYKASSPQQLRETVEMLVKSGPDKHYQIRSAKYLARNAQLLDGSSVDRIMDILEPG